MTNILDQVARARREFRPETSEEFFALQLARKLRDTEDVRSYVNLVSQYSEDVLLRIYRNTVETGGRSDDMAERFRRELRRWIREKESNEWGNKTGRI